jgi:hypothetical protein
MLIAKPVTLQTVGVRLVKVTGLPDAPPVALAVKLPSVKKRFCIAAKVMVCVPAPKTILSAVGDTAIK